MNSLFVKKSEGFSDRLFHRCHISNCFASLLYFTSFVWSLQPATQFTTFKFQIIQYELNIAYSSSG